MSQVKSAILFISYPGIELQRTLVFFMMIACAIAAALSPVEAQAPRSPTPASVQGVVDVQTMVKGLEHPWSLAFLPDKRMLVTERPGRLRVGGADRRVSAQRAGVRQACAKWRGER